MRILDVTTRILLHCRKVEEEANTGEPLADLTLLQLPDADAEASHVRHLFPSADYNGRMVLLERALDVPTHLHMALPTRALCLTGARKDPAATSGRA